MRWLLFLSRLAFIWGVFFLLAISLQIYRSMPGEQIDTTDVFIGYLMVVVFIPFVNLCYAILYFVNRQKLAAIPRWLLSVNAIFLLLLILYVIYLNDR
ncbi:MAG: hypothetical protein EOO14_13965 [Chitinophagaceae bacterium]|nr:MAG: hypothetical protein EOO14_13965 [Chitinophagaceae bacterium]